MRSSSSHNFVPKKIILTSLLKTNDTTSFYCQNINKVTGPERREHDRSDDIEQTYINLSVDVLNYLINQLMSITNTESASVCFMGPESNGFRVFPRELSTYHPEASRTQQKVEALKLKAKDNKLDSSEQAGREAHREGSFLEGLHLWALSRPSLV